MDYIKADPDAPGASPASMMDEDIYEDTGDLEFNTAPEMQGLFLARVPPRLWDAWSKLDDDAEIQIGTLREIRPPADKLGRRPPPKFQVLLSSDLAQHQLIPKEYDLGELEKPRNTFVFSEQDLPGYKSKASQKFDPAMANMPARLNRMKVDKPGEKPAWNKNKKNEPYYRKAIPKKTAIAGRVSREMNFLAVANEESDRLFAQQSLEAHKPKRGTKYLDDDDPNATGRIIVPGVGNGPTGFEDFIKTNRPTTKKEIQAARSAPRIPQNELYDRIVECFKQHNYWSMRAFKERINQPEAYLRSSLERIADLVKSGRFAMHWQLKPENKHLIHPDDGSSVPSNSAFGGDGAMDESDLGDIDGEDEDEEDVKMEDVLP